MILVGDLTPGGAGAISAHQEMTGVLQDDEMLDRAAMESGSD